MEERHRARQASIDSARRKEERKAYAQRAAQDGLENVTSSDYEPDELLDTDENAAKAYAQNNRIWLLARAIPARTFGIGANAISGMACWDMESQLRSGWYETPVRWGHSSFKNVAYIYTYPMYKRIVLDGGLQ
jgi:hypothetical protein